MKFVDVKNDIAFRKVFGNENKKEILISFLNAVLELPDGKKISEVEIKNPFLMPEIKGLKSSILDVRVTDAMASTKGSSTTPRSSTLPKSMLGRITPS